MEFGLNIRFFYSYPDTDYSDTDVEELVGNLGVADIEVQIIYVFEKLL